MRVRSLLLFALLAACDPASTTDAGSSPVDAGTSDAGSSDAGSSDAGSSDAGSSDAGSSDAGSSDAGSSDAGSARRGAGTVSVTQSTGYTISGVFLESVSVDRLLQGALSPLCTEIVESGGCLVYECPALGGLERAGTLTAHVNEVELGSATPGASNEYLVAGSGRAFTAGDTIRFTGSGDVVPAFDVSVTAPAPGTATLPSTVTRATPLVFTWTTATAPDRIQLALSSPPRVAVCIVDGGPGTATVDTTVLGALAAGTGGYAVSGFNQTTIAAGEWDIVATAAEALGSGSLTIE